MTQNAYGFESETRHGEPLVRCGDCGMERYSLTERQMARHRDAYHGAGIRPCCDDCDGCDADDLCCVCAGRA